jgi:prepilin-type N-terminal cleavage/methylation domain-containing protein
MKFSLLRLRCFSSKYLASREAERISTETNSMQKKTAPKGFTLIELIIVIAIICLVSVMTVVLVPRKKSSTDLTLTVAQVGALLREAQSRSVTDAQGVPWGVYFSNATKTAPFYALFSSSYSTATIAGYYRLPADIAYATATLASGATTSVLFQQVSGVSSAATIGFLSTSQRSLASSSVSVSAAGTVAY